MRNFEIKQEVQQLQDKIIQLEEDHQTKLRDL
jgi:hypothetical protein